MRKRLSIIFILSMVCLMFGCREKKQIILYEGQKTSFKIIGYGKRAPFSPDPSFYCFLDVPAISFRSGQIDNILIFQQQNGEVLFVYKNNNNEHILLDITKGKNKEVINSEKDIFTLGHKEVMFENFSFSVLNEDIVLSNVKALLLRWHSGGVKFYGFKELRDGLESAFNYANIKKTADMQNSGWVVFTDWNPKYKEWPEIQKIERDPGSHINY